jgi:hypothetical protein
MLVFIAEKPDDFGDVAALTSRAQVSINGARCEELEFALATEEAISIGV